ncbi:MAG: MarR family transcriptional regulator [Deltaproteobacteria bacterium]|nr:MarR family transcriptional regulator [Deltaproteobacteria bacterium]
MSTWTFLSNHAHVLLLLGQDPDLRMRDIAEKVNVTERAVQRIVHDLVEEGYVDKVKEGRCNHYAVNFDAHLRHPLEAGTSIRDLLSGVKLLGEDQD